MTHPGIYLPQRGTAGDIRVLDISLDKKKGTTKVQSMELLSELAMQLVYIHDILDRVHKRKYFLLCHGIN